MAALILPEPKHRAYDEEERKESPEPESTNEKKSTIPSYLERTKLAWKPSSLEDFGDDGGAFPEIRVSQFPLHMGQKGYETKQSQLQLSYSKSGGNFDIIMRQGQHKDKKIYSRFTDLIGWTGSDDSKALQRPNEDNLKKLTEATRNAINKRVDSKIAVSHKLGVKHDEEKTQETNYIKYTTKSGKEKIIRVEEEAIDPLEPPRFKSKKFVRHDGSPPVPVMHSPEKKLSNDMKRQWNIPPPISNWKNARGFMIPLHMRLASDGRGLQQHHLSDRFAHFTESLHIAKEAAREEIEKRAAYQGMVERRQREEDETKFFNEMMAVEDSGEAAAPMSVAERERAAERKQIEKDLAFERNLERKKKKYSHSHRDARDVTDHASVSKSGPTASRNNNVEFDSRLTNYNEGLDDGFGSEDAYNVYDKRLTHGNSNSYLYRPRQEQLDAGVTSGSAVQFHKATPSSREQPEQKQDDFAFLTESDDSQRKRKASTALDGIGRSGFMKTVGGSGSLSHGPSKRQKLDFAPSSSST